MKTLAQCATVILPATTTAAAAAAATTICSRGMIPGLGSFGCHGHQIARAAINASTTTVRAIGTSEASVSRILR